MRRSARWLLVMAGGVAACASHNRAPARPPAAATGPGPVRGVLVDRDTGRPLAGRLVAAGGRRGTTDPRGGFTLDDLPATYDLVAAEADGSSVSVYRGLQRRDPLLVHTPRPAAPWSHLYPAPETARVLGHAEVAGGPPVRASGTVAFFAAETAARADLTRSSGPSAALSWNALGVRWPGAAPLAGELIALLSEETTVTGAATDTSRARLRAWTAQQPLTLAPAEDRTVALVLSPVRTRTYGGTLQAPAGRQVTSLQEAIRLPLPGAVLPLRRLDREGLRSFEDELPDPAVLGGRLCATATSDDSGTLSTTVCASPGNREMTIVLQPAPRLVSPPNRSGFEPPTRFSWSPFAGGIHVLELRVPGPAKVAANLSIYTTETSAAWPDLTSVEIPFPKACSTYQASVAGHGPYGSMDEAFGPDGLGAQLPAEARASQSPPIDVLVPRWPTPAPGSPEARFCHFPYGKGIVCGESEYYMLSAINNKLRAFPQFAEAVGIFCVRDCATARRFMKAYGEYANEHPGFDKDQPLDMEEC